LQHSHFVANAYTQSTARGSLTYDDAYYRHLQAHHFKQVAGYSLTLSALFCFQTGISARSVYKRYNRLVKLLCQLHQAQRFAVTLRIGHTKVAQLTLFGIYALLMTNKHYRLSINLSKATHNGFIIPHISVAKKLSKLITDLRYIV